MNFVALPFFYCFYFNSFVNDFFILDAKINFEMKIILIFF